MNGPPRDGGARQVLIASGFGEHSGGGLAAWDGEGVERLDTLSTIGIASDGARLYRSLALGATLGMAGAELAVYDERGLERYVRLDDVHDVHDVLVHDGELILVSTGTNELVWLSPEGAVRRRLRCDGTGDAWHLNSLAVHDGHLFACAFGRFTEHRSWGEGRAKGTGFVFHVESGEEVASGLTYPHTPRFIDGRWFVCDSGRDSLVAFDGAREAEWRLDLGGWTRGLAACGRFLYVGVSAIRDLAASANPEPAQIAVVDRHSWEIVQRIDLPFAEVYDLVLADPAVLPGLRVGLRTNALRVGEQERWSALGSVPSHPVAFWAQTPPLGTEHYDVTIEVDAPEQVAPGAVVALACSVTNNAAVPLASAPPFPVLLTYRWLTPETGDPVEAVTGVALEGVRTPLRRPLAPGASCAQAVTVHTPRRQGTFRLVVTLVEERAGWFDVDRPDNAATVDVRVAP